MAYEWGLLTAYWLGWSSQYPLESSINHRIVHETHFLKSGRAMEIEAMFFPYTTPPTKISIDTELEHQMVLPSKKKISRSLFGWKNHPFGQLPFLIHYVCPFFKKESRAFENNLTTFLVNGGFLCQFQPVGTLPPEARRIISALPCSKP